MQECLRCPQGDFCLIIRLILEGVGYLPCHAMQKICCFHGVILHLVVSKKNGKYTSQKKKKKGNICNFLFIE